MKNPRTLTVNELIRIAKDSTAEIPTREISDRLDEATKFALAFKMKPGKHKVYGQVIWQAYTAWTLKPTNKNSFFQYFSKLFERKPGKYKHSYMINYQPAELLNEAERMRCTYE
jgi:hypothetical protein